VKVSEQMKKKEGKEGAEITPNFEDGMTALEEIVARLESGELSLEESLNAYEKGVGLVRTLNDKLSEAEKRIEVLSRAGDGRLQIEEIDEDDL
jgi:exodeoxyribonuclease VII small subunit